MPLPKPKPWATELHSAIPLVVPTAANGYIPGWSTMRATVEAAYQAGKLIVYVEAGQQYVATALTQSEMRFEGRFAYTYPNGTSATQYIRVVTLSTGAVTSHTARFEISNYT